MITGMNKWKDTIFQSSTGKTPQFKAFTRDFKKIIRQSLPEGCELANWNNGHFECFWFIIKPDGKHIYCSISDVRHFPGGWFSNILIRTAKNTSDYTGGSNNYTDLEHFKEKVNVL